MTTSGPEARVRLSKPYDPLPPGLWRHPLHFLSLGFGSGLSPVAPGTAGTLAAIPLYLLAAPLPWPLYALLVLAGFALGTFLCGFTANALRVHDHPAIVWDEVVGFLATMFLLPAQWPWVVAGFFAFRFFDVLKPWPIRWVDRRVTGGFGIMLDDLLAAVYAGGLVHALRAAF